MENRQGRADTEAGLHKAGAWWSAAGAACGPHVLQWQLASDLKELSAM